MKAMALETRLKDGDASWMRAEHLKFVETAQGWNAHLPSLRTDVSSKKMSMCVCVVCAWVAPIQVNRRKKPKIDRGGEELFLPTSGLSGRAFPLPPSLSAFFPKWARRKLLNMESKPPSSYVLQYLSLRSITCSR